MIIIPFLRVNIRELSNVMSLRDLVLCVLLISIDRFATTSSAVVNPRDLQFSPEAMSDPEDVLDRWKMMNPEPRPPEVKIYLIKGHILPDEVWEFTNEYKYSDKNSGYV